MVTFAVKRITARQKHCETTPYYNFVLGENPVKRGGANNKFSSIQHRVLVFVYVHVTQVRSLLACRHKILHVTGVHDSDMTVFQFTGPDPNPLLPNTHLGWPRGSRGRVEIVPFHVHIQPCLHLGNKLLGLGLYWLSGVQITAGPKP